MMGWRRWLSGYVPRFIVLREVNLYCESTVDDCDDEERWLG